MERVTRRPANLFEEVKPGVWMPANDNRRLVRLVLTCLCGAGADTHVVAGVDLAPIIVAWRTGHAEHKPEPARATA